MNCYNCGGVLSEKDFCTRCGVDVSHYKKTIYMSNAYYNIGLEQANVRNLSGAIISLHQSLKFNKNNVEARNLLGLIYYEMGEIVTALSEWVISKNIRGQKNIANDYLDKIQKDQSKLEMFAQMIRKYNQALLYCQQDSEDLGIIQLKKVLSMYENYLKAHLLLALLYIHAEEWDKAKTEVERAKTAKLRASNERLKAGYQRVKTAVAPATSTGRVIGRGLARTAHYLFDEPKSKRRKKSTSTARKRRSR